MTHYPDAEHYLAGPLEGWILKRFGLETQLITPQGIVHKKLTALTEDNARTNLWVMREEAYRLADAGRLP